MREKLATQALKHLSFRIASLWFETGSFGTPRGKTPDTDTAGDAAKLTKTYIRARKAYDAGGYLAAIEIATEDEAHE